MKLSEEQKEKLNDALTSDGGLIDNLIHEYLNERIEMHRNTGGSDGDLIVDMPRFYKTESAINEDKELLKLFDRLLSKFEESQ